MFPYPSQSPAEAYVTAPVEQRDFYSPTPNLVTPHAPTPKDPPKDANPPKKAKKWKPYSDDVLPSSEPVSNEIDDQGAQKRIRSNPKPHISSLSAHMGYYVETRLAQDRKVVKLIYTGIFIYSLICILLLASSTAFYFTNCYGHCKHL